jgi:hypothetical protein
MMHSRSRFPAESTLAKDSVEGTVDVLLDLGDTSQTIEVSARTVIR